MKLTKPSFQSVFFQAMLANWFCWFSWWPLWKKLLKEQVRHTHILAASKGIVLLPSCKTHQKRLLLMCEWRNSKPDIFSDQFSVNSDHWKTVIRQLPNNNIPVCYPSIIEKMGSSSAIAPSNRVACRGNPTCKAPLVFFGVASVNSDHW